MKGNELLHWLDEARRHQVELPDAVLEIFGMHGWDFKRFLNTLCYREETRFLELGTWKGGSITAASYKNPGVFVTVDNFSQFGGKEDVIELLETKLFPFELIEGDHWSLKTKDEVKKRGPYNIFYYDGEHSKENQCRAITDYYDCLEDDFILVVDDWSWPDVREGTLDGLKKMRLKVGGYTAMVSDALTIGKDTNGVRQMGDRLGWWNGCGMFVLQKTKET